MYVRTGARAQGEEATDFGKAHGRARTASVPPPSSSEWEVGPLTGATFLQRHWWLWPVIVIVCGALAGALGLAQVTRVEGR
jgi:hypothetical protein